MPRPDITDVLLDLARDRSAMDRLLPLVYDELLAMARAQRWSWNGADTPGTTSLVHEAYLKLVNQTRVDWRSRAQFFCVASRAMRSILIDNARFHHRRKRDGGVRVPLEETHLVSERRADELLSIDRALERLSAAEERLGRVVECRVFGGLTVEETAEALQVSAATVKRDWNLARAWLYRDLGGAPTGTETAV
jgi:RNA polymerase sigma factor (TIGR02999 family)